MEINYRVDMDKHIHPISFTVTNRYCFCNITVMVIKPLMVYNNPISKKYRGHPILQVYYSSILCLNYESLDAIIHSRMQSYLILQLKNFKEVDSTMSKKVLSLVLALVMVLGTLGTAFADTAAAPAVNEKLEKLKELGLVIGNESGDFGLENAITRAEMATVIVRALGLEDVAKASQGFPSQFSDMNGANVLWARGYVNVAVGQGIIKGYPEGTFLPANNVTYAEAIAMLVRAGNGITAEEEEVAVWPTTYLAKAAQLGVLDGTAIADYNAPAVRGTLFDILYNAVINLQMGDYQVVKAIVLENYRVEKLNKDEVVVEIIEEVQRAKFVEESRKDMRGEQLSLTIPAKIADVEALLGRVYNFTLNKAGEVVSVAEDTTFKVEVLTEEDVTDRKFGDYTVELRERRSSDERDDRIFRTYYNNEDFAYEDFVKELGRDAEVEYAKVTTKNGKVVYIDAFNFDDIAPVKEVRADGATVVVYNDAREGTTKNISLKATDDILFVSEGNVSVGTREDIKALDVIHEYDGGFIVRKDAAVNGTYEKVTSNRDNEYFVVVEGEEYEIGTVSGKQAVYVYDENEFYTLSDARKAGATLKEFEDEEATILLDLTEKLQYIGAEIELGEFAGIVTRVIGDRVRVLKSDDKTYDYTGDLDTKVDGKSTGHKGLNDIDAGDLVYMAVDGETIDEITVITKTPAREVTDLDSREIVLDVAGSYRVLSNTLYFRSEGTKYEALTAKEARDAFDRSEKDGVEVLGYVVDGSVAEDLFGRRAPINKTEEAWVVVFTQIKLDSKTEKEVVQFDGWANNRKTEMDVRYEGENSSTTLKTIDDVDYIGVDKEKINGKDILKITVSDDDNKDISEVRRLIENNRDDVYEVVDLVKDELTVRDANGVRSTFYTKDAKEFGGNLSAAKRVKISVESGKYLDAVLVVSDRWDITANEGTAAITAEGIVTLIDATNYQVEIEDSKGKVVLYNVTGAARALFVAPAFDGAEVGDAVKTKITDGRLVGLTVVKTAAELADEKSVADAIAKVEDSYEFAYGTTVNAAAVEAEVITDIADGTVTVAVAHVSGDQFKVTLTKGIATDSVTVTAKVVAASTDASVKTVKVKGVTATKDSATVYSVELPNGTTYSASDIVVTPTDSNATVATAIGGTADTTSDWTVEIEAEDELTTETITVKVVVLP